MLSTDCPTAVVALRRVLVEGEEVGVPHRLAHVARGSPGGVPVRLDRAPHTVAGCPRPRTTPSPWSP